MGAGSDLFILAADREFFWTGAAGVGALVLAAVSLGAWRKKWEVDDTPTSTCRGVFVGRNEVAGRAVPTHQPMTSPFSSLTCVWFEWHLEHYVSDDDGGSWHTTERRSTAAPFWIEDDTGRVLVRPRGAEVEPQQTLCNDLGRSYAPPYSRWQLRQWVLVGEDVQERQRSLADASFFEAPIASTFWTSGTADPIYALKGRNRITERVLQAGQPVYLLGDARPRTDATGLEFCGEGEGDLLLTTKSEEEVSKSEASSARWTGVLAIALAALFAFLLSAVVTGSYHPGWPLGTAVGALVLLFLVTLVRNYNRQVTVKQQAAKAWSMIDISLRRRADLLPNLAQVAEAFASHEHDVQATVAELRADPRLPAQEELPQEGTLVSAEASDRGQRAAAASAFALAEAYPDLKASAVFVDLQRRIVDAEEAVASARTFYNDAINVLRDRRQQFPGSLFARMVAVPSWRLFEAEEVAMAVPMVAVAPAQAAAPSTTPPAAVVPPAPPPAPPGASSSF